MLDLTWKVFCMTGNVDTYLLFKEMENDDPRLDMIEPESDTKTGALTNTENQSEE